MKRILTLLSVLFLALPALANDHDSLPLIEDRDIALWYARYAVHESARQADEVPLWEVLKWRASGPLESVCHGDLLCSLHEYSARRLLLPSNDRTRSIANLNREGAFPGGAWISERGWTERFRQKWLDTLARADAWYASLWRGPEDGSGTAPSGATLDCRYRPHHWGGMRLEVDRQRADRALREGRWRRAECEGTSNGFFCVVGLCEELRR